MTSLDQLKQTSLDKVNALNSLAELEKVRVTLLGKNGEITSELKKLGSLPAEERKDYGQAVNMVKVSVTEALETKKEALEEAALNAKLEAEKLDVTLPAAQLNVGKMHPVSYVIEEVEEILSRLGFSAATGPEVETDFYNFTALNIPEDHPARQDQ